MKLEALGATIPAAMEVAAKQFPENGYTFQNMAGEETFYAWPDVLAATERRVAAMQAMGIKKGDRVGLIIIEPEDFVLTFAACCRAGIVPVPLYPPMSMGELDSYVDRLTRRSSSTARGQPDRSPPRSLQNVLWQRRRPRSDIDRQAR